jgi:serine/threonine protein kinase
MPLCVGEKLGHYEVLSLLGQGGMGEVYCARDTKQTREVAVKVLPLRSHVIQSVWRDSSARPKCWLRSIIRTSRPFTAWSKSARW